MRSERTSEAAALTSAATQRWIEAAVEERVQKALTSTKQLSDWVATTCQQGVEASRLTAVAVHESEEARRVLESNVRRLREDLEGLRSKVVRGEGGVERLGSLELRLKAKEVSDQARDEEVSGLAKEVQALHMSVQRLELQWEKANGKFNKLGIEVASCTTQGNECLSAQAVLESRVEAVSQSLSDLDSEKDRQLERLGGQEFRAELDALKDWRSQLDVERAKWSQCHDTEQRRSVENLQRRMQSMQVALETMAQLRQEDRAALEELKGFRYEVVEKMNDFQTALEESVRSEERRTEELEIYFKDLPRQVKLWTKEASRELREKLHEDFQAWVKDWEHSFRHELPRMERELKKQLWALKE